MQARDLFAHLYFSILLKEKEKNSKYSVPLEQLGWQHGVDAWRESLGIEFRDVARDMTQLGAAALPSDSNSASHHGYQACYPQTTPRGVAGSNARESGEQSGASRD